MTTAEEAHGLVNGIDFPHLRDGGRWRQESQLGQTFSFNRACMYAARLRALGMGDAEISCLLSDLYWDAATEAGLNAAAKSGATASAPKPAALPVREDGESLKLAVEIMTGLLASGHYTELDTSEASEVEPSVRFFDHRKGWKEDGCPRRISRYAVSDAIMLLGWSGSDVG